MDKTTVIINVASIICSVWVCCLIHRSLIQKTKLDGYRFRLFALRDKLAIEAMGGEIDPYSEEYETMTSLINSTIKRAEVLDPFTLASFFLSMSSYDRLIKTQERLRRLDDKCTKLVFLRQIHGEYFSISRELFGYNLRPKLILLAIWATQGLSTKAKKWYDNFSKTEEYLTKNSSMAMQH
jgi:hypothetical protein